MLLNAVRFVNTFSFFFLFVAISAVSATNNESQIKCSRTCVAENCNAIGIRYGKYCGVGWSGCPGEKPCDDLDACCEIHDECVEIKGLLDIECHEDFKICMKKVQESGKVGFSRECSIETAVHTMTKAMDVAILLSQFGGAKYDEL
ncbi:hypothetical protein HRI_005238900 [Hibiscus trionum]|nr:hypothetical protein HRI_005238900 [Hibiscus trionum]